jgi:hypothetical protein
LGLKRRQLQMHFTYSVTESLVLKRTIYFLGHQEAPTGSRDYVLSVGLVIPTWDHSLPIDP